MYILDSCGIFPHYSSRTVIRLPHNTPKHCHALYFVHVYAFTYTVYGDVFKVNYVWTLCVLLVETLR